MRWVRGWAVAGLLGAALAVSAQPTDWKVLTHYDKNEMRKQLTERVLRYGAVDSHTQAGQVKLAKSLAKELKKNGVADVTVNKQGVVVARLPATAQTPTTPLVFWAYLDAPAAGKPLLHANYKGGEIALPETAKKLNLQTAPELSRAAGHDLITGPLGNKAGLALLLSLAQYLYDHAQLAHGPVTFVFVPGALSYPAQWQLPQLPGLAYSFAGAGSGEWADENMTGYEFEAVFGGNRTQAIEQAAGSDFSDNILMAADFYTLLPRHKRPENTADTRGFMWIDRFETVGDTTTVHGLLRAFGETEINRLQEDIRQAFNTVKSLNRKGVYFALNFREQYRSMKPAVPVSALAPLQDAMRAEEISPKQVAVRGAALGAFVPRPFVAPVDVFSGTYHSRTPFEYVDIQVLESALRTALQLVAHPGPQSL